MSEGNRGPEPHERRDPILDQPPLPPPRPARSCQRRARAGRGTLSPRGSSKEAQDAEAAKAEWVWLPECRCRLQERRPVLLRDLRGEEEQADVPGPRYRNLQSDVSGTLLQSADARSVQWLRDLLLHPHDREQQLLRRAGSVGLRRLPEGRRLRSPGIATRLGVSPDRRGTLRGRLPGNRHGLSAPMRLCAVGP